MYVHTYVSTCYVFTYVCVYLWIPDKYSLIFRDCWAFVDAVTSLLDQLIDKALSSVPARAALSVLCHLRHSVRIPVTAFPLSFAERQ